VLLLLLLLLLLLFVVAMFPGISAVNVLSPAVPFCFSVSAL